MAITYIAMGYALCAGVPFIAERVAYATIDASGSPFTTQELVEGALATRDYSFGAHDLAVYEEVLRDMNKQAGTPYADVEDILSVPEQYTVTQEAISHLDDVNRVAGSLMMPIFGIAAIAAFLLFASFRMFGTKPVAMMLLLGGCISVGLMLVVGIWALVSFDSFFSVFHSLFFDAGTWTFPSDSLLITMLPEGFWAGIGGVWIAMTLLVSIASIALGLMLRRRG